MYNVYVEVNENDEVETCTHVHWVNITDNGDLVIHFIGDTQQAYARGVWKKYYSEKMK